MCTCVNRAINYIDFLKEHLLLVLDLVVQSVTFDQDMSRDQDLPRDLQKSLGRKDCRRLLFFNAYRGCLDVLFSFSVLINMRSFHRLENFRYCVCAYIL